MLTVSPPLRRCCRTSEIWLVAVTLLLACSAAQAALRLVSPGHPAAADAGAGTPDRPYRTLAYAMSQLMPGDTLTIAAGTYREALVFPPRAWSTDQPTLITGERAGGVTVLGTDVVTGWTRQADGLFVKQPWQQQPQQVMVKQVPLKQIGGTIFDGYPERADHPLAGLHRTQGGIWPTRVEPRRNAMPVDSFFYDAQRQALFIRSSAKQLHDGDVEVAARPYLLLGRNVAGITVKHIRFRHANTSTLSRQGAITLSGHGNRLQRLTVEDMDGAGIEMAGDDNVIADCVVARSGYLGIKARGRRNRIVGNDVSGNNTRGFNKWWEAGGMKFIGGGGLRDSLVAGNRVHHNHGDGIWFDWGNRDNTIEHNVVAYNDGFGIHYEASSGAHIIDNQVFANRQRGIYLPHSSASIVAHNLVLANGLDGIAIVDEGRTDPDGKLNLRPYDNQVLGNTLAWNNGAAVILPGAAYANHSDKNLFVQNKGDLYFSMGWPKTSFDKNSFERWRSAREQDLHSTVIAGAIDARISHALEQGELAPDWSKLPVSNAMVQASQPVATLKRKLSGKAEPK
jgi:parallel beta-helix repeat protein